MKKYPNPLTLTELSETIPVVRIWESFKTGYLLEYRHGSKEFITRYENYQEVEEKNIPLRSGMLEQPFNDFLKELRSCVGRKKICIDEVCGAVLLAYLNGGEPEDYYED